MPFQIKKDKTKWIIAGTGSGWELLPKQTNNVIFCLNDYVFTERYRIHPDLLCIMDALDEKPQVVSGITELGDVVSRINAMKIPLISPYTYEEIPLSKPFPLKECVEKFGLCYFTNTISYMIAYALMHGAKELNLYGINQASSSEYFYEKCGVEAWLGVALGMGVKVTIHGDKSEVFANKARFGGTILYGYNASFENVIRDEERFGKGSIKKLANLPKQSSRTIRIFKKSTI